MLDVAGDMREALCSQLQTSYGLSVLSSPDVIFATVRIYSAPEGAEKSKLRPGPCRDLGRGLDVSGAGVDRRTAPSWWWPDVILDERPSSPDNHQRHRGHHRTLSTRQQSIQPRMLAQPTATARALPSTCRRGHPSLRFVVPCTRSRAILTLGGSPQVPRTEPIPPGW